MADLTTLVTVKPETITALNDTIKIVFGALGTLLAGVGTIYSIRSAKSTAAAKANTEVTAINTKTLTLHTTEMLELKKQAKSEWEVMKDDIAKMQLELATSVNEIKIVSVKVAKAADSKLGMIPKLQDALTVAEKNADIAKTNSETLLKAWDTFQKDKK